MQGQHLIVDLPGRSRLLGGDLLNCVSHVYYDIVIRFQFFMLEHEQTDVPFDAFGLATGVEAFDLFDPHGDAKTHGVTYSVVLIIPILARRMQLSIESVLILGIGNTLLSDEGIGVHVVERLRPTLGQHPDLQLLDGGTLSFTLAEGLIVVDAARMHSQPGTVRVFMDDEMDLYLVGNRQSVHEVSLTDLLDIARLSERLPRQRCLIGIEPKNLDWGDAPSPALLPSIDRAVQEILTILGQWGVQV